MIVAFLEHPCHLNRLHHLYLSLSFFLLILNIPLFLIGRRVFGNKALFLTIYGTVLLSVFIWIWQRLTIQIDVSHDTLIAALLAGACAGLGSGLVFRYGGTTGGGDIIGRVVEAKTGRPLGQTLFMFDALVLIGSLSYISLRQMVYTLIASFVYSQVMPLILNGGYAAKGVFIITRDPKLVSQVIFDKLDRGATYVKSEGAYTHQNYNMLYIIVNPREVVLVKEILAKIDPQAFISIFDVDEVIGEGFTWGVKTKRTHFLGLK